MAPSAAETSPTGVHILLESQVDGVDISLGLFLPPIAGCDWPTWDGGNWSHEVPGSCRVPLVIEAGPYYSQSDAPVWQPGYIAGMLLAPLHEKGIAYAQVSVRGTGFSGGCIDLFGPKERADLDQAVTFFGTAPWSNGRAGMTGVSYDGTTPYEVAALANPHLATIVPMAGVTNLGNLSIRNGTVEQRAPIVGPFYWTYGLNNNLAPAPPEERVRRLVAWTCAELAVHEAFMVAAAGLGTPTLPSGTEHPFFGPRAFDELVPANYNGSVFLVQGFRDRNVDPTMAIPFLGQLQAAGIRTSAWLGQWQHQAPTRDDTVEALVDWFDHELRPGDPASLAVLVQDSAGAWRQEATFPPPDATWAKVYPTPSGNLSGLPEPGLVPLANPFAEQLACQFLVVTETPVCETTEPKRFLSEPFADGVRISGMPQFHVTVHPTSPGGILSAFLYDVDPDGKRSFFGRAMMDLRYASGGNQPMPVVPGVPLVARMEFEPLDAHLLPGHRLLLEVGQDSELAVRESMLPSPATTPVVLSLGEASPLRLPTIVR